MSPPAAKPAPSKRGPVVTSLDAGQVEFLEGLLEPAALRTLDELPSEDRWFLAGIQKRWHARELELPVLSEAAIRLTDVLRSGDAPLARYVELVESDSALTVEVLRSANAAMFAGQQVSSLDDAIRRIGLSRLGSVLIMAQLKKKVLSAGSVANKAALLMDLAPLLGIVASQLATPGDGDQQIAFTRGSLFHVEHMVILGAVADVSRDRKQPVRPSVRALLQACRQFGPEIRQALATAWKLEHALVGAEADGKVVDEYLKFRAAIISRWLDRPLPMLPDIEPARLATALGRVAPRIDAAAVAAFAVDADQSEVRVELVTPR